MFAPLNRSLTVNETKSNLILNYILSATSFATPVKTQTAPHNPSTAQSQRSTPLPAILICQPTGDNSGEK